MKEIDIRELKFGIYNRKSSDSEDKQVQSIETQERENNVTAERSSLNLVKDALYSETKSAFTPGRSIFAQMVHDIERGKINAIITVHPNRLARNSIDGATLIELMDRKKLLSIKTASKVYFPTSTDKMMLAIEFIFSKKDSDDKSDAVKGGLRTKALKGLPSGVAYIGFLNDFSNEKGNRKWRVDEERFPLVALLLARFLEGNISGSRLHRWAVKELKLTTPRHKRIGGALVSRSRMYEILKDPIYAGFFVQDGVRYDLDPLLPRIITEDQHNRILRLLGAKYVSKTKSHLSAYTQFIRGADGNFIGQDPKVQLICDCGKKFAYLHRETCPACDKKIEDMESPKYLAYTFYYNVRRKKTGQGAKHIEERKVTSYLKNYVRENLTLSKALADWSRKYIQELADKEIQEKETIAARKMKLAKELEGKKARYREMLADGLITPEEYRTDMERLQKALATSRDDTGVKGWLDGANEIINLTQELENILENGVVESKRSVLARLGSNLIWDEKKLTVVNKKSVQALIDGLSRTKRENAKFEPVKCRADKDESGVFAAVRPSMLRTWDNVRLALMEE